MKQSGLDLLSVLPGLCRSEMAAHRNAIEALLQVAKDDTRITGVSVGGSIARGSGDRYSDVDVSIETIPSRLLPLWQKRQALFGCADTPIYDLEEQWTTGQIAWYTVIYENGLYMDGAINADPSQAKPGFVRVWCRPPEGKEPSSQDTVCGSIDKAAEPLTIEPRHPLRRSVDLFWCGAQLCAKYAARGDLWSALGFAEDRRAMLIKSYRWAYQPEHVEWGYHSLRQDLPEEIIARLPATVPGLDAIQISSALLNVMDIMLDIQPSMSRHSGVDLPVEGARKMVSCVRQILRSAGITV